MDTHGSSIAADTECSCARFICSWQVLAELQGQHNKLQLHTDWSPAWLAYLVHFPLSCYYFIIFPFMFFWNSYMLLFAPRRQQDSGTPWSMTWSWSSKISKIGACSSTPASPTARLFLESHGTHQSPRGSETRLAGDPENHRKLL